MSCELRLYERVGSLTMLRDIFLKLDFLEPHVQEKTHNSIGRGNLKGILRVDPYLLYLLKILLECPDNHFLTRDVHCL